MSQDRTEESVHPRLLMLSEFEGEVEGELKFHKSMFQYRQLVEEVENDQLEFTREERGPTDRGFSSVIQSYEDLGLVDSDNSGQRNDFMLKRKGHKVTKGIKRGLSKLKPDLESRLSGIEKVSEKNKDRSGNEITSDESVQEAKEETYQSKL